MSFPKTALRRYKALSMIMVLNWMSSITRKASGTWSSDRVEAISAAALCFCRRVVRRDFLFYMGVNLNEKCNLNSFPSLINWYSHLHMVSLYYWYICTSIDVNTTSPQRPKSQRWRWWSQWHQSGTWGRRHQWQLDTQHGEYPQRIPEPVCKHSEYCREKQSIVISVLYEYIWVL